MKMEKRGASGTIVFLFIILVATIISLTIIIYTISNPPEYSPKYEQRIILGEITNPAENLDNEQAIQNFNENFVYYFLVQLKAFNLYNPPFSEDNPKINLIISDSFYSAEIKEGEITVDKKFFETSDITIIAGKEEIISIIKKESKISELIKKQSIKINENSDKKTLYAKGYKEFYENLEKDNLYF